MTTSSARQHREQGSSRGLVVVSLGLLTVLVTPAAPASAYVRYRSTDGCPYGWRMRDLPITGYPQGLAGLDEGQIANAATQAALAWSKGSDALGSCTDLDLQVTMQSLDVPAPVAKYDHQNILVFRGDAWCPDPIKDPANCKDAYALAITSVFAGTKSGEIFDADIEVNALKWTWGDLVTTPDSGIKQDLQNALTHEMGHFIGLDHTCYMFDAKHPRPVDNNGNPVPDCSDPTLSDSIRATTMFASADPGDTSKRTLEPDDQQAVCDSYPIGRPDPMECSSVGNSSGCALASPPSPEASAGIGRSSLWAGIASAAIALTLWAGLRRARVRGP